MASDYLSLTFAVRPPLFCHYRVWSLINIDGIQARQCFLFPGIPQGSDRKRVIAFCRIPFWLYWRLLICCTLSVDCWPVNRAPLSTRQCRWTCRLRFCPPVCRIAVMPNSPFRRFLSAAKVFSVCHAAANKHWYTILSWHCTQGLRSRDKVKTR